MKKIYQYLHTYFLLETYELSVTPGSIRGFIHCILRNGPLLKFETATKIKPGHRVSKKSHKSLI